MNTNISFPYPVMGIRDDFITGSFEVKFQLNINDNELDFQAVGIEVSNEYLRGLLNEKKAVVVHRIVCPSTFGCYNVRDGDRFTADADLFANALEIQSFIVANERLDSYWDDSFHTDYHEFMDLKEFGIDSGSILAITPSSRYVLNKTYAEGAKGLFKWSRIEGVNHLGYDLSGGYIEIQYPHGEELEGMDLLGSFPPGLINTFLVQFVLPSLSGAFELIRLKNDQYDLENLIENHEWAEFLTQELPEWDTEGDGDTAFRNAQSFIQKLMSKDSALVISSYLEIKNLRS